MTDAPVVPRTTGPDADGFTHIFFEGPGFNAQYGEVLCRAESDTMARVRIAVGPKQANPINTLHGGFLLAFLDQALFAATVTMGRVTYAGSVTLSLSSQFVAGGRIDRPVDCLVEVAGETRQLLFLHGTIEQGDHLVMTFQANVRKLTPREG